MSDFNWEKCIICPKETHEQLRCPTKAYSFDKTVYESFLRNVDEFKRLNALPAVVCLDVDSATVDDLVKNESKWHRSCHLKFSLSKLQKAQQRVNNNMNISSCNEPQTTKRTNKRNQSVDSFENVCIFCEKGADISALQRFSGDESDKNLRRMIYDLNDYDLLAKISGGSDLVAIEAKYHIGCLTDIRNRHKTFLKKERRAESGEDDEAKIFNETRAFLELTDFIENSVEDGVHFFVVAELHSMYENRLKDMGVDKSINRFRLKNELLTQFPEAQEESDVRRNVLVF